MTVTVDVATENIRTGTTSPQTFSHAGAASGIKGVILCLMHGTSGTDHVSAASYGGTAMTRLQRNACSSAEPGAAEIWFLGASVPQGTQTVSYTPGATTDDIHAVAITLRAATDLSVLAVGGIGTSSVSANPSVALGYRSHSCMAFAAGYSGLTLQSSVTAGTNCTKVGTGELTGVFCSYVIQQTTGGTSDFTVAATASSDDVAFAAAAVGETLTRTYTVSGGAVSGGTATTAVAHIKGYTGTGGAASAGAAVTGLFRLRGSYTGSGGSVSAGTGTTALLRVRGSYVASGGAVSDGTATTAKVAGVSTKTYVGTGGAVSAGSATTAVSHVRAYMASGGAITGGAATTAQAHLRGYPASGGAVTGGAATTVWVRVHPYIGSGGAVSGGTATTGYASGLTNSYACTGSGGSIAGGAATTAYIEASPVSAVTGRRRGRKPFKQWQPAVWIEPLPEPKPEPEPEPRIYVWVAGGGGHSGGSAKYGRAVVRSYEARGGRKTGGRAVTWFEDGREIRIRVLEAELAESRAKELRMQLALTATQTELIEERAEREDLEALVA